MIPQTRTVTYMAILNFYTYIYKTNNFLLFFYFINLYILALSFQIKDATNAGSVECKTN